MGRKISSCLVAVLVAVLAVSLVANLCLLAGRSPSSPDSGHGPEEDLEEELVRASRTRSPQKVVLLELVGRTPLRQVELRLPQPAAARLEPGRAYYLPSFYAE